MSRHTPAQTRGALAATLCYFLWGLVPLYWKQLSAINPIELIAHRHIWSLALLLVFIGLQHRFGDVANALRDRSRIGRNFLSATLLTGNWLFYVWGVNS